MDRMIDLVFGESDLKARMAGRVFHRRRLKAAVIQKSACVVRRRIFENGEMKCSSSTQVHAVYLQDWGIGVEGTEQKEKRKEATRWGAKL